MIQRILNLLPIIGICAAMWRCSFPSPVGEDIVQREILDVVFIDTIDLRLSTVIYDSFATSNAERHLVGFHEEFNTGKTHSKAFFTVSLDSVGVPDEDADFLSAELELFYDGYFHYDTIHDFTLQLFPLLEELELDDGLLYNVSEFSYGSGAENRLGQVFFEPRPRSGGSVSVPLSDGFGLDLFEFIRDEDDFFEDFPEEYPGFVLDVDTTSSSGFLGFRTNSRLILHYRESGEDFEIVFSANGLRFNQIANERSGSSLEGLETIQEDIPSTVSGNQSYLHNGVGTAIKVEIPFLREIREVLNENFITEATLVLRPVKDSYDGLRPLPSDLIFYEVDRFNRVRQQLNVDAFLNVDDEFGEDTEYRILITDFLQRKIDEEEISEDALLIQGGQNSFGVTVDQLVLGDVFSDYEVSLELFILDYIIENE